MIDSIRVKEIIFETFQDYKNASMLIATCFCDWKCLKELQLDVSICQNCMLAKNKTQVIKIKDLFENYTNNKITSAIVFGGLEPMLQFDEMLAVIDYFRCHGCDDEFIIYTGYNNDEVIDKVQYLMTHYRNIIIKFGRFVPNEQTHYDNVLGVMLASQNQYAIKIS